VHASIADFLLDIVQNSWEAGASTISLDFLESDNILHLKIDDDGRGMDKVTLAKALDPFFTDGKKHPGRKVGLGLPFLQQAMDDLGQNLVIDSEPGRGTTISCAFPLGHLDCPPVGDLIGTMVILFCFSGDYEMCINRTAPGVSWTVCRTQLLDVLGDFDTVSSRVLLREYLESMEDDHGQDEP
jgi:hypothetical protein